MTPAEQVAKAKQRRKPKEGGKSFGVHKCRLRELRAELGLTILDEPTLSREFTRELHEHETLLSWNADKHAEMFEAWWNTKGFRDFAKWAEKHEREFGP